MELAAAAFLAVDNTLPYTHRLSIHPNTSALLLYPALVDGDWLVRRVRRTIGPAADACYFEAWPTNPTP